MTLTLPRRTVAILVVAGFVAMEGAVMHGQRPQGGPPAGGPIAIDFTALGANGQVVRDLTPADVTVRIAGRQRKVSALTLKTFETAAAAAPKAAPPFATNTPSSGRSILFVIETASLRPGTERAIRESLDALFKQLGPNDRVALSVAPQDTVRLGFGAGLPAVREALGKIIGERPASVSTNDTQARTRDTLSMLRGSIDAIGGGESPTAVVFVSAGLAVETTGGTNTSSAGVAVTRDQYQGVSTALANARANLFIVLGDEAVTGRDEGLQNLSGITNAGPVLRLATMDRILAETSAYYMATLEPDPSDRPGQTQRLEVRVTREGVTAHARSEVGFGRPGGRAGGPQKVSPRDMLRTPAPFTDLQARATAFVSRGKGDSMIILALVEPVDPSVKLTALSAGLVDSASKLVAQSTADEKQFANYPVPMPMAAAAGKYRLRLAMTDAEGRSGAVDLDLDANLTPAGPLKIGSILLAAPKGQAYAPQMQFSDDEIAMQVELYGQVTGQVSAKVEVAESTDGPAVVTSQVGGQGTSEPDKFILSGKIPIAKLAPGDYVVRFVVQMEGHPEGKVYRTLRKVAK